ncbi:MAG: tRNA (uracil-5-)-methyltransferase [Candidatus Entotheonella factor]|uniref:Methylenetetrahydrofolate--tRNA-(uracil-5-)-methyltransferase TrmFO n=1 Tax=Entotheonella factor TaxID=1429438 RepID=W4LHY1_ENTF1|nr:methylenetetrahydrofolate--tRNA-(uracil(54)-C(5))-methyltransferase (FADH(2)-oxidizing) TrmFO [Candidatus Entotheonella palauensis]ETW97524.1 MAG: tRNA (uracil-5-)-methyltransferase [Candidatus Entotheonella factor]
MHELPIVVIGGGLAGTEAAYQLACRGLPVQLYEMRPQTPTPAHETDLLGELVCSNSLKADTLTTAHGLLKAEMRRLDSLVLRTADASRVPAGSALAVDRQAFAAELTRAIEAEPNITLIREEVKTLPHDRLAIVASGPLTSAALTEQIQRRLGGEHLYFYDALSPIIAADSVDCSKTFMASRYDVGGRDDYVNCPLDREGYERLWQALVEAECVQLHAFEKEIFFEGCLPVEELARRGPQTLAFGPLKPVGLRVEAGAEPPHAVVQLRLEDRMRSAYNLVGFQTRLKYGEQRRIFRMIPGLEQAEFLRYGSVHRNTFLNAPRLLHPTLQARSCPSLFFAGQITGVEGYMESAATGLLAGINAAALIRQQPLQVPPAATAHGALVRYIAEANADTFQPMNIHFGLLPPLAKPVRPKKARREAMVAQALKELEQWRQQIG